MIEVQHLRKRYSGTTALDDVSFTVETGSICGLLGPNGAGKSTTMNIMTGCLAATEGEVRYDGLEIYADMKAVKPTIGYLPEQPPLYLDMTVWEYLLFVARAKGLSHKEAEAGAVASSAACGLTQVEDRLIKNLSKGYKQRVGIAQALIGNPQTIILDEPTVGLDPIQIIEIRDLIRHLAHERTVVISSHILQEIRALCDHIVIISHGKVVANDTPEALERQLAGGRITQMIVRTSPNRALEIVSQVPNVAQVLEDAEEESTSDESLAVLFDEPDVSAADSASDDSTLGATSTAGASDAADTSDAANTSSAADTADTADAPDTCSFTVTAQGNADIREDLFKAFASANISILEMSTKQASLEDIFVELTEEGPSAHHHFDRQTSSLSNTTGEESGGEDADTDKNADADTDTDANTGTDLGENLDADSSTDLGNNTAANTNDSKPSDQGGSRDKEAKC